MKLIFAVFQAKPYKPRFSRFPQGLFDNPNRRFSNLRFIAAYTCLPGKAWFAGFSGGF
jgi:hypothetical protein